MTRIPFLAFAFTLGPCFAEPAPAQSFRSMMKKAVAAHGLAADTAQEMEALEQFLAVTAKHKKEWLGHYWACYLATQVARGTSRGGSDVGMSPAELVASAMEHFEQAQKKCKSPSKEQQSDLHALRGFLTQFEGMGENPPSKEELDQVQEREFKAALRANSGSPLMDALLGIQMTYRDYPSVLAGKRMLQRAEKTFAKMKDRSKTTYFVTYFVSFWIQRADQKLAGMIAQ